ncbi:MAG: 4Fe-4S binding protein [Bacteroidales bacterium]|jgi:Fe-S-cluster-containing dehydrogenase component|nr:4Fe-4S binding protein [Bacteroidales bacterium]
MRKGFTFDAALCVSCKACSAACVLENGLLPGTRTLFAWNDHALPLVNVINLSLACNHCSDPACASGCPAVAYTINEDGVVIHHPDRCMGCGYCTWRCPYDAPKINAALGYIEKCHFCAGRTAEGIEPACVTACPTGALKMTETHEFDDSLPAWIPDTGMKPSVTLRNTGNLNKPRIIPADNESVGEMSEVRSLSGAPENDAASLKKEWSLVAFSLLVITASVMIGINVLTGSVARGMMPFLLMAAAMIVSVIHLGRPERGWRAVLNIISSPLSREVTIVILLTGVTLLNWLKPGLIPPLVSAIMAVMALISIDLVYFAADRSMNLRLHSGQAFFTALYAASWFVEPRLIFTVFSMLAAVSVVLRYESAERMGLARAVYYFRAMALPLVFILIYPGNPVTDISAMVLFVAGLVADRLLFYIDFNPPHIRKTIREHFEKEYDSVKD